MTLHATKPIIADPAALYALGIRTLIDSVLLVHVARCGLLGAQRTPVAQAYRVSYETVRSSFDRLEEMGLIKPVSKGNKQGGPLNFVVTVKAWSLVTTPADFSLFPHAQTALKIS